MPKPGAKDDPVKAGDAVSAWKMFKKQIREVLKVQQRRLESAMVATRRWSVSEFATHVVSHPLMGLLAQGILWGGLDATNRLATTFRVTEDRTLALRDESPCSLDGLAGVVIVHPLHLADDERRAWQDAFTDHEILPAFPQLGRRTYRLQPGETQETVLRRFDGKAVEATMLMGVLDRMGWERGPTSSMYRDHVYSGGLATFHLRYFPNADLTAVLRYRAGLPAVGVGVYQMDWPDQTLDGCFFLPGLDEPSGGFQPDRAVPLGSIDAVVLSEVLTTLETLAGKAG